MSKTAVSNARQLHEQEIIPRAGNGRLVLLLNIVLMLGALVILCGNKDAQTIVNSGSLY